MHEYYDVSAVFYVTCDDTDVICGYAGYGPEIWADYRDFEEGLLASSADKAQQVQRIRSAPWRAVLGPREPREPREPRPNEVGDDNNQ